MRKLVNLLALVVFVFSLMVVSIGCKPLPVWLNERGISLLEEGQYEQAILEFNQAIALDPQYGDAFNNRGVAYTYVGEYDKAIADFSKAIELDLTFSDVFNNRGVAYAHVGEYDKAIADFNKAIELEPNCIRALRNQRVTIQARDEKAETIADLAMCVGLLHYPSQRTEHKTCGLIIRMPPVLLVHGFQAKGFDLDEIWADMTKYLTGKDVYQDGDWEWIRDESQAFDLNFSMKRLEGDCFVVYISNYTHVTSDGTKFDIKRYAQSLASEIEVIKTREGVDKVDIIAHSMGGLVVRVYIENEDLSDTLDKAEYKDDIRKLIMLGTPNHGTSFADFFYNAARWESVQQMQPGSSFLLELNEGVTGEQKAVEYSAIAGNIYQCKAGAGTLIIRLLCVLFDQKDNDGVVSVESVNLEKQGELDEIPQSRWLIFKLAHSELRGLPVCPIVEDILTTPVLGEQ